MFNNMLSTSDSCAQRTLAAAMVEWWMATDEADALKQINAQPGCDLAGIQSSVVAGLTCCAELLDVPAEQFISEADLNPLAAMTSDMIVDALDAIHRQWIKENFNARRWAEKTFKGQLGQFRKTSRIPFDEVVKDLLFIEQYLKKGGSTVSLKEIEGSFYGYCRRDVGDEDLLAISDGAYGFTDTIVEEIQKFREKSINKPEMVAKIDAFLSEFLDPTEIITETLSVL